ncbi:MAG: hypothetical protein NVS9B4_20480 [Candidatus Acidiferrum sp.]
MSEHPSVLRLLLSLLFLFAAASLSSVQAQDQIRVAKKKTAPDYPPLARHVHAHGIVRIEITIAPEGKVKSARVIGGSPLLLEAAQRAAMQWEFEPAPKATSQMIEFRFDSD